jgi:hypothetical protein
MKKLLCTVCVITLFNTPAFALLAPLGQSIKELNTILSSKELSQRFAPGETLQKITREEDSYLLQTESHEMKVELIYPPSKKIGPREFKLVFGLLKDRQQR